MNELASLLPIVPYAVLAALLVALLRRLAAWNEGPSLAALVGGPRDLPWPRGIQEEEPVRWDVQRLRRPRGGRGPWPGQRSRPALARTSTGSVSNATPWLLTRHLRRSAGSSKLTELASLLGR